MKITIFYLLVIALISINCKKTARPYVRTQRSFSPTHIARTVSPHYATPTLRRSYSAPSVMYPRPVGVSPYYRSSPVYIPRILRPIAPTIEEYVVDCSEVCTSTISFTSNYQVQCVVNGGIQIIQNYCGILHKARNFCVKYDNCSIFSPYVNVAYRRKNKKLR